MKIYDISMPICEGMMTYKNRKELEPRIEVVKDFDANEIHETSICIHTHTGTHIDAPFHMLTDGAKISDIDLYRVITNCRVLDLTYVKERISCDDLETKNIKSGEFLLLKTQNSLNETFVNNFIYLDESGAKYLKEKGIIGVGIDSLGIERNQINHETHKILLKENTVILEGLRLGGIIEGKYFLSAAPINIKEADGSLVRAILIDFSQ